MRLEALVATAVGFVAQGFLGELGKDAYNKAKELTQTVWNKLQGDEFAEGTYKPLTRHKQQTQCSIHIAKLTTISEALFSSCSPAHF